ncbi:MAG: acyl-CoA--6-aminopenicillanic acid acyl-transferase [Lachnospiraceae bacterium]|nr:acyl-CoA--6-aminopenicillanic acid acyl-transferase [Lachnospiraceae bacterium]
MEHLTLKGAHYELGVQRGKLFNRRRISFPLRLDTFQLQHGKQSEELLRKFFPEVCEEIRGISDTTGTDYLHFVSWMLCMGCCMYNLEQNMPAEIRGCTAFAYSAGGKMIYGRNNDLPPCLRKESKADLYVPIGGNLFYMATSSFVNGEEGLNEHGLAVAMTFVMTDLKKIRPGFNACFLVRYLLEKANDTEQAISQLCGLPIASNCNLLLADKNGGMAVVECTPSLKKIRRAERAPHGGMICTVNSFTSNNMKPFDDARGNDYGSQRRYKTVLDAFIAGKTGGDPIDAAKCLLKGDYGFICQYDDDPNFETVWSSIFDLSSLTVYRAEGDPRKNQFVRDSRLHNLKLNPLPNHERT